jgi:hypothetical protein
MTAKRANGLAVVCGCLVSLLFVVDCGMLNVEDNNEWGSITKWGQCTLWCVICLVGMGNLVNQLALMKIGVCAMLMAKHTIYWRTLDGRGEPIVFK